MNHRDWEAVRVLIAALVGIGIILMFQEFGC